MEHEYGLRGGGKGSWDVTKVTRRDRI